MRDGSITLDDYDAQSVRQVGTDLFMSRIDHLIFNDYERNTLSWTILSSTLTTNLVLTARLEIQTKPIPSIVSHMRWSMRGCEIPRNVLQADTIVVSCGLANFEQSSWSTHRRHEFWGTHEELRTNEEYNKFVHSFKDNYPGICKEHSTWTIDCRRFDDPDNDRSMRKHIGRNSKIMKSILESGN